MGGIIMKSKPKQILPTTKKILTDDLLPISRTLTDYLLSEEDQTNSDKISRKQQTR
jgi:hypothetical protein